MLSAPSFQCSSLFEAHSAPQSSPKPEYWWILWDLNLISASIRQCQAVCWSEIETWRGLSESRLWRLNRRNSVGDVSKCKMLACDTIMCGTYVQWPVYLFISNTIFFSTVKFHYLSTSVHWCKQAPDSLYTPIAIKLPVKLYFYCNYNKSKQERG